MKIDSKIGNLNLNNLYNEKGYIKLKEGSILTAKLIDIFEGKVLLDLGKGNYITGTTELNLNSLKNSMISFLIKGIENNIVEIKPLLDTTNLNNLEDIPKYSEIELTKEIIKLYSIDEKKTNADAIESMIKFKMPLNKENVLNVIKSVNNLDFLIKATEDDLHHLLDTNQDLLNNDISIIIANKENQINMLDNNNESHIQNSRKTVESLIREIKYIAPSNKLSSDIIKQVVFLKNADVKISINNIKNFVDLIDEGNIIESKINIILDTLLDDALISKSSLDSLKNFINGIEITFTQKDKDNINSYYKELNSIIDSIKEQIANKPISIELQDNIEKLDNTVKLVNKLNENLTFLCIPFTFRADNFNNAIYILNKNKKTKLETKEKVSAFIKLDTKNLSTIEVMCLLVDNSLNLNFKVEKQFISFFEENKTLLINALSPKGFSKVTININEQIKKDMLELLADDEYMNYKLNVKV